MNKPPKAFDLANYKLQAAKLLKAVRSNNSILSHPATIRFQRLPEFSSKTPAEIAATKLQLKHALAVIARENNFNSWADLKVQTGFIKGGFLNNWFNTYAEAKAYQQQFGGFLLPYKQQFFICEATYIEHIGFNPNDPDWILIDRDWVSEKNPAAKQRLYKKWQVKKGKSDGK